jgi:hypothetical protein
LTQTTTSPGSIQACSAILPTIGFTSAQDFSSMIQSSIAFSIVGIILIVLSVSICVLIPIGFTQKKNKAAKIRVASKKFMNTHASIIIICCQAGLFARLYGALFSSSFSMTESIRSGVRIFPALS